jgi:hypothetical protein
VEPAGKKLLSGTSLANQQDGHAATGRNLGS